MTPEINGQETLADLDAQYEARRGKRKEGKPQGSDARALTDMGNAERLVDRHGQDLRHCHEWGKWLVWDDVRWRSDGEALVFQKAKETTRAIAIEAAQLASDPSAFAALMKHALESESNHAQKALVDMATREAGIPVQVHELDAHPWLLNLQNGTVDLRTGELLAHRREDLCTKLAPVTFDAAAKAPRFEEFLRQVMDDRVHLVEFLQRYCGYACTGDVREQVLLFLHGDGSNGKSTLLNVLLAVLGDYAQQAVPDLLMSKGQDAHPTEVAELVGKRAVICTEVGEGKTMDEVRVKQLTGGDMMKGRFMRQDFFSFLPTHKIFLASNPKPNIRGADFAIWRRILLLPFDRKFAEADKDPLLGEKLKAESSGILNWLIQGCLLWQRMGLQPPEVVRAATAQYRSEEDLLTPFFEERCVFGSEMLAPATELYAGYVDWAQQSRLKAPLSQKKFGSRLALKGLDKLRETRGAHVGRAVWKGIGLRDRTFSPEPSDTQIEANWAPADLPPAAVLKDRTEVKPLELQGVLNHRPPFPHEQTFPARRERTGNRGPMVQDGLDGSVDAARNEPVVEDF